MLSRDLGGIQQVFLDYDKMLKIYDIEVVNITSRNALINQKIKSDYLLPNFANWDWFSILYLKKIIRDTKPNVIIAHGGRATRFCFYAKYPSIPMVGLLHSGKLKWVDKSDYIIALTQNMYNKASSAGIPIEKLLILPNAIDTNSVIYNRTRESKKNRIITVLGAMARMVPKKAIDVFIKSLALLKTKGFEFDAIIGGTGSELSNLQNLVRKYHLEENIEFIGWVEDQKSFFDRIDIFCHPSVIEPFGVAILESMLFSTPVIAAAADGPKEIITNMSDGILTECGSATDMAKAIELLLKDKKLRNDIANKAFLTVREAYDINVVGKKLVSFLYKIQKSHESKYYKTQIRSYDSHL